MRGSALGPLTVVVSMTLVVGGATSGCESLECGVGTHEESGTCVLDSDPLACGTGTHEEGGECVADTPECVCGPGTIQVPTDLGCECVVAPTRLLGVRVCGCMDRPVPSCNASLPGPCEVEPDVLNFVMATADEGVAGISLAGGEGVPVPVDGGLPEIHGLERPFRLDGQPARVPLGVATDGSFTTDPGAQVLEWEVGMPPSQPGLPVRGVSVTGVLDAAGRLSEGGHVVGCFTPESAAAIYLDVLSQTLLELTESSGEVLDCDATGSGTLDGSTLDLKWWPGPAIDVIE
jgi:hypothetical protein